MCVPGDERSPREKSRPACWRRRGGRSRDGWPSRHPPPPASPSRGGAGPTTATKPSPTRRSTLRIHLRRMLHRRTDGGFQPLSSGVFCYSAVTSKYIIHGKTGNCDRAIRGITHSKDNEQTVPTKGNSDECHRSCVCGRSRHDRAGPCDCRHMKSGKVGERRLVRVEATLARW